MVATKRPARRRRLDPHVRREQLLGTALRVVGQLGDCYFPSWKHLLVALRQRILEDYAREVADKFARANKETWRPTFEEACIHFVDFVVKLGGLHEALFHGPIADHPIDKEQSAPNTLARILHLGMELGAIEAVDIEPCAHLLFSILHSTADAIGQGGDRERFLGCMRKLFCRWL